MPVDKQHITKTEISAVEHAIQIRTDVPGAPIEGQIWFNSTDGSVQVHIGSNDIPLKTRALAADPPSPLENETWINTTTSQFKYFLLGVTHVVDMTVSTNSAQPEGALYAILSEVELGNLSANGVLYPNFIMDAFNAANPAATLLDVAISGQALRLQDGQNSGQADYELETSSQVRKVQGIAVYTPTAMKPLTVVDNLDGTTTITVQGDVTGLFAIGKKLVMYKEITVSGDTRSVYVTDPADNYVSIMSVVSPAPSFNPSTETTTLKISNNTVDVLAQLSVSQTEIIMYPLDISIESGGNGPSAVTSTQLQDAHGLPDLRTLGGDAFRVITGDLATTTIIKSRTQRSKSGQYVITAVMHLLQSDQTEMVFYYSIDGMATINRMVGSFSMGDGATFNTDEILGQERFLNDQTMMVNDDGRFMLAHPYLSPGGVYHLFRLGFGNLTDPSPTLTYFADMGGGPGIPYINTSPGIDLTPVALVPDDTWNYVFVCMTDGAYPAAQNGEDIWYRDGGATFLGTSGFYESRWGNSSFYGGWYNNLEGEKQLVIVGQTWNTGLSNIKKKKLSQILASPNLFTPGITHTDFQTNPGLDGETRITVLGSDEAILYGASFDVDAIRLLWWNLTTSGMEYGQINLAGVIAGTDAIQHISFSSQPASGQWSLNFAGQTTTTLGFSATAAQIQVALRALSTINGPYVNVTGDYISGFDVEFVSNLGKAPQVLMTHPTNTLQNITPTAVTINIVTSQPGLLPVPPTFNAAGYRQAGTGDRVALIPGPHSTPINDQSAGSGSYPYQGTMTNASRRFRKDPLNNGRFFFAYQRSLDVGNFSSDGLITQVDDSTNFLGLWQDNFTGSNNFDGLIRDVTDTFSGDKVAQLITANRASTIRTLGIRTVGGWGVSPTMPNGFRTRDMHFRCKLVGIDGSGNPDETNVIEISPTLLPMANVPWSPTYVDMYFRFNTAVTLGQQFFAVFYTENFTASVDWPNNQQQTNFHIAGSTSAPVGLGYYRNGAWNLNNSGGLWIRLLDHNLEHIRSPDTFQYSRMDIHGQNSYYGSYWNIQCELVSNTQIAFSYEFGANTAQDAALRQQKRVAYRVMNINALGTFLSDANSPATQFPGMDAEVFDPNLMMHVRLGDPMATNYDRHGNLRLQGAGMPIRYMDWAGSSQFNWNFGNHALLNNTTVGMQPDPRFKSGWCERFGQNGSIYVYQGSYGDFKADNFCIELEVVPSAADITGNSGGLTMFVSYANGNGWYFGLQNGQLYFYVQNEVGSALASPFSQSLETLVAETYYRIRAMRCDDQTIKLFIWRNSTEGWKEVQYRYQAVCNNQYLINYDLPFYIGAYFNNQYLTDGKIGEVKMVIGTNTFKSDGLVDQRNMYAHENLGTRIVAKHRLNAGNITAGTADDYTFVTANLSALTPGRKEGLYAAHDQLLVYNNLHIPEGKDLAVKVHLDRVSADDTPAVQGFLLNFSK